MIIPQPASQPLPTTINLPVYEEKPRFPFWIILIFIFTILAVGAGAYFLGQRNAQKTETSTNLPTPTKYEVSAVSSVQPTIDVTVNWRTYVNNLHRFEFKYPQNYLINDRNFKIQEENSLSDFYALEVFYNAYQKLGQYPGIKLVLLQSGKTIDQYIQILLNESTKSWQEDKQRLVITDSKDDPKLFSSIEVTNKSNIKAKKIERSTAPTVPNYLLTQYFFKNDNYIYVLTANYGSGDEESKKSGGKEKEYIDKIFQTFKFLDDKPENFSWVDRQIDLYKIYITIPSNWTIKEINRRPEPANPFDPRTGHDCAEYQITSNDNKGVLNLKPSCGFIDGGPNEYPKDSFVVKNINQQKEIIRFFNSEIGAYLYKLGFKQDGNFTGNMYNILSINYDQNENLIFFTEASFRFSGSEDKKNSYLKTADEIVSSLRK